MDFFKEGESVNWGVPGAASCAKAWKPPCPSIVRGSDEETEAQREEAGRAACTWTRDCIGQRTVGVM